MDGGCMKLTGSNINMIVKILKKRFPNLTAEEVVNIATEILENIE
jgi:20S proteasome alpha/beta subunit